jgi:hypothetical protein
VTFQVIGAIDTKMDPRHTPELIETNVRSSMARGLPMLHDLSGYGKWKGRPIALAAGGPSLNRTLDDLRAFDVVMACGSAHDHLVKSGVRLAYAVHCDPDPVGVEFFKSPQSGCRYLVASMCDPALFDRLQGFDVTVWHNRGGVPDQFYHPHPIIEGGCSVTLRALNIAIMLGYHDIHFFGFDSSFDDDHHAYDFTVDGADLETSDVTLVKVNNNRVFKTNLGLLAQATHFQECAKNYGHLFNPTVHGDGLIAEMMKPA